MIIYMRRIGTEVKIEWDKALSAEKIFFSVCLFVLCLTTLSMLRAYFWCLKDQMGCKQLNSGSHSKSAHYTISL